MTHKIKNVPIFMTGTHNGYTIKDADIVAIVAAFTALGDEARVPLKFGHNTKQAITDGQPALGWVERVWKEGAQLLADFVDIPTIVFDAIRKGLYKSVSVELIEDYNRNGSRHPWVLDAVALLGADKPAVRGLTDLKTLSMTQSVAGFTFKQLATFTQTTTIGATNTMTDEEIKALEKRVADAELALANEKKAQFAEKVANHRAAITTKLEAAVVEGRIEPRTRDRVVTSRQFKDDQDVLTAWTMADVDAEIERGKLATFKEKKAVTSKVEGDAVDFAGKTVGEVLTFKAEQECVRLGNKVSDYDAMCDATNRVLRSDKKLATAYFSDPRVDFSTLDATA